MSTYNIQGRLYGIEDLERDLVLSRINSRDLSAFEEAKRLNLLVASTNDRTLEKAAFLKERFGYGKLNARGGKKPIESCEPGRVHAVFVKCLDDIVAKVGGLGVSSLEVESAKKRLEEYKRLSEEDLRREKEAAAKALEDFKSKNPEKYWANVMAALRN